MTRRAQISIGPICGGLLLLALPLLIVGENQIRHQELSGDAQDTGSLDPNDSSNYDPPDIKEDTLTPPNELSVIRLNDTSVVLRWEFPVDAQDHLLYFKMQHKSTRKKSEWTTDPQEISANTRAFQVNNLRPGNFLFSVIAVYDNQDNAPSKPLKYRIKAKTKIPPDDLPAMEAPIIFWTEADSEYFRFKWKYDPKTNDTEDYGFLVYYRSKHAVSDFHIYNTMNADVEVAELEPDTPYEAKVVAYNENGASEFSETITIRTKSKQDLNNSTPVTSNTPEMQTSTISVKQTTTTAPQWPIGAGVTTPHLSLTTKSSYVTTSRPAIDSKPNGDSSVMDTITTFFKPIFSDQSDGMLTLRYLLLVLLPLLFVVFGLTLCLRPYGNKKESCPPSSTDNSQFDLEINGYFKNSFPGVEE